MVPLEANKLFAGLSAVELERVRKATREISFAPQQIVFKEGDEGNGLFLVKSGLVKISAVAGYGDSKVLTHIPPGEIFGEMAVVDNQPRSASAVAEEATTVYFIERGDFDNLLTRAPHLAASLVREISGRLRQFNREVLESERLSLVGRFASSIVHDLKNPLNIIGISADMAAMPSATPESRLDSSVRIRKQVERISNMVNELLEFTQGGRGSVIMAPVNYKNFVEQIIGEIQPEAALKSVKIEYVNPPPDIVLRIVPQRLTRVFHNFISNAADAMNQNGGGTVKIRFEQGKDEVTTELWDDGPGIAPEIMDRLFQAFATYGKANGTGLGLSICKKIVQDHNGRIYARNAKDRGAIFGFALPIPAG
jgi:signal transduction histidine kinase